MYGDLAEKFKTFLIAVRRHCGQKHMTDWSGHIEDGVSHYSACRGILIFEPLTLQKINRIRKEEGGVQNLEIS